MGSYVGYGRSGIAEITILDAMANGYRPLPRYEPLHDVIRRMATDAPSEREHAAEEFLQLFEAAQLKSDEVKHFVARLQEVGARVIAKFPDGREQYLPLSGFHVWQSEIDAQSNDIQKGTL